MTGGLQPFPRRTGGGNSIHSAYLDILKQEMGSAYTKEDRSLVGARNIALARALGQMWMLAQKIPNNAVPKTATDNLLEWAERLGVPVRPTDTEAMIRQACVAKYKLPAGATRENIQSSLSELLRTALLSITEFKSNTLASTTTETFWNAFNPGPPGLALDSEGAWISNRCHIVVSVQQPNNITFDQLLYLVNVQMAGLLDTLLPAYCTWEWNLGPYGSGFILGNDPNESHLTWNAL